MYVYGVFVCVCVCVCVCDKYMYGVQAIYIAMQVCAQVHVCTCTVYIHVRFVKKCEPMQSHCQW